MSAVCCQNHNEAQEAYELFGNQRDGVVKVALTP
jgi:hypothetical protein